MEEVREHTEIVSSLRNDEQPQFCTVEMGDDVDVVTSTSRDLLKQKLQTELKLYRTVQSTGRSQESYLCTVRAHLKLYVVRSLCDLGVTVRVLELEFFAVMGLAANEDFVMSEATAFVPRCSELLMQ